VPAVTKVDEAAALEAEAEEYPDERGEILLEAAVAWREAGRPERARELLGQLIEGGGEDRCYARFQLADDYFSDGADETAYAELALLSREPALHDGHCELAADLLAERGDLPGALKWYDRAVARLSPETLDELRESDSWLQPSSIMLRNRRDVRRRLGLTPDAMDEMTPGAMDEMTPGAPLGPLADFADIRDRAATSRPPREVRMLVFQRGERAEARRRWPGAFAEPDEEYYPAAERRWRELSDSGVPSIRVVPAGVADLCEFADRAGLSPTDDETRTSYAQTIPQEQAIVWPPPRNSACWCGSGTKYKKCCGQVR
jgi:tetratricopeptide (TPR) repeat protein